MKPAYDYGSEVRLTRNVRNDGTYPGKEVGEMLIRRGSVGVVYDVGTYLQDQLIYRVNFLEAGMTVGCREEELILAEDEWIPNRFEFREKVVTKVTLQSEGNVIAPKGTVGEVQKVVREPGTMYYLIKFSGDDELYEIPELALAGEDDEQESGNAS